MLWAAILSITPHQGEPGDPELLHWIKDRIDNLLGLDAWAIVAITGLMIVLMPPGGLAFYLLQHRRQSAVDLSPAESEEE